MASKARGLARGSAWILGSQILLMTVQLGYTAVTSRIVAPAGFGAYAVAMSAATLMGLLSNAGLGSAASRAADVSSGHIRALCTFSLVIGAVAAGLTALLAPLWAALWDNEQAVGPMYVLALGILVAPTLGVLMGLARRTGRFRALSLSVISGNLLAMAGGLVCVLLWRGPAALAAMGALAAWIQLAILAVSLRQSILPTARIRRALPDVHFGFKSLLNSLLHFFTYVFPSFAVSRAIGPVGLGNLNRAVFVTVVPAEQVQVAVSSAIFPEFRDHTKPTDATRRVWTDLLIMAAQIAWPLGALAIPFAPSVFLLLLGPTWVEASTGVGWMVAYAALSMVSALLATALEASARFKLLWLGSAVLVIPFLVAGFVIFATESILPALIAFPVSVVAAHSVQVIGSLRAGLLDGPRLARGYGAALALAAALAAGAALVVGLVDSMAVIVIGAVVSYVVVIGVAWIFRERIPAFVVARSYGLVPAMLDGRKRPTV